MKHSIEFTQQQLIGLIAALFICFLFMFMAGYYWGKKSAVEQLSVQFDQESFADRIYSSMCMLYDNYDEDSGEADEASITESENGMEVPEQESTELDKKPLYSAELVGFSSLTHAQRYLANLLSQNIKAHIAERISVGRKGVKLIWYQIVTDPSEHDVVIALVEKLKIRDKLRDVKIVELSSAQERQNA